MERVDDASSLAAMQLATDRLGRSVGGSTGTNLCGAFRLIAEMLARGQSGSVVTLICEAASGIATGTTTMVAGRARLRPGSASPGDGALPVDVITARRATESDAEPAPGSPDRERAAADAWMLTNNVSPEGLNVAPANSSPNRVALGSALRLNWFRTMSSSPPLRSRRRM